MSLNMAYPCWDAPLAIILSKQLIACQARTRCDISFTFAVRSIFFRAHQHLIQRILQKLHDLLQKVHVQPRSKARKLKFSKRGRRLPFDKEGRMLRSEIDFPPVSQIGDRRCPQCRTSMRLAWIEPDEKPGYDRRTFECLHCQHLITVMVKYRAPAR
jgi:hypothetical protein